MKTQMLVFSLILLLSYSSLEAAKEKNADPPEGTSINNLLTLENHLAAIKQEKQQAESLETKIEDLQSQIHMLDEKPYLDTKGFRRASLRVLKGDLIKEVEKLTHEIAFHKAQAKELLSSDQQQGS